jgi:Papain-like cysteine protease AvrRpt2
MNINHSIAPIRQPNLNDCWATCSAMVLGLNGLSGVAEVKRRAHGVSLYPNGSIRPSAVPPLASRLHLHLQNLKSPPQELTVAILTRALSRSAAAAFGEYVYPGAPTSSMHVLLFYRLSGSDTNPMIYFVDPYTGSSFNYLMDEFNEGMGSVDYFLSR